MGEVTKFVGRPEKPIDLKIAQNAVQMMCTAEEVAALFDMSVDTLDRRLKKHGYANFADFFKTHSVQGKMSLRRAQFKKALEGNPTMLIWLGKQYLDQKDKIETTKTVEGKIEVNHYKAEFSKMSVSARRELAIAMSRKPRIDHDAEDADFTDEAEEE